MVLLTAEIDPVAAFWRAHADGETVGVSTSGTVSRGRVLERTTASWVDSFGPLAERFGLPHGAGWWIPGPLAATMNLFAALLAEWLGGTWSAEYAGQRVAALTPHGLAGLLDDNPGVELAVVAGDALTPALAGRARAAGVECRHYYGAAELSLVAVGPHSADLHLFDGVAAQARGGAIWVRSPWLALGVAGEDGWAGVGDLGELDGDRLTVWGRGDGLTIGGQTIALGPLTDLLQARAAAPLALFGLPHETLGRVLACALTSADDLVPVRDWARANLTGADRPRLWRVVGGLPVTPAGKLDRAALVELVARHG